MEERFGVRGNEHDGVFFSEQAVTEGIEVRPIRVEISRQNSDLNAIKKKMAGEAQQAGANVIGSFAYGQRKHPWWKLFLFKWDTESWYGEGIARRA
jgi:hypothetical protein